jgi:hypothetical protein
VVRESPREKPKQKTMNRITRKTLESRIETLNSILGNNPNPYTRQDDGKLVANIGTLYLSQAYGGYCVNRMCNESGGCSSPIWDGHIPTRDAYELICAFMRGLDYKERNFR